MASSTASYIILTKDLATGRDVATEVPLENCEIHIPKQTAVDKIGGILCYICDSIFGNKKDFLNHYSTHNTSEVVYTCVVCKKQHSAYPNFRNHCYLQHIVKDKFPCQQCNKSFSRQTSLTAHIISIHDFKCSECDEKFKTKKDLQIHKIVHNKKQTDVPPYNCTSCQQVLSSIDMCETHINDHCEVLYPCPICADVFPDKKKVSLHLTMHFDEKVTSEMGSESKSMEDSSINKLGGILCCHCDQLFKTRVDIDCHFASEHEDKVIVYSCNICEKQYTKYSLYGDHCYSHTMRDKFQCDQCNRLFPRLPLLVMHTLAFHAAGAGDRPFQCDKCIYGFLSHYRLAEHKRIVHNDHNVKCQIPDCTATFNTPLELIAHQRAHASCLENWCRQCGFQFPTLAACERHLDFHRRKMYACPVCARTYRERYLVLKHLPKHFESVLHICKVCGRSYSARNRLIEHAKSHAEVKKHKCAHCSKTFRRPGARAQHEQVHLGNKPYRCSICPKTFAAYPNWTKHLTRSHAYDKTMIKQLREASEAESPNKTESGIESASSEISDIYPFSCSDDDDDASKKKIKKVNETNAILNETVNEAIYRVEEDLERIISPDQTQGSFDIEPADLSDKLSETVCADIFNDLNGITSPVLPGQMFNAEFNEVDDSNDIKAIVEHIDALSGGIQMAGENEMQFTDLVPLENVYDTGPSYTEVPTLQYPPAEYGPDFHSLGSEAFHTLNTEAYHGDSEHLPHIDPNLTIKKQKPTKLYIQNVQRYEQPDCNQGWEPVISKVLSYNDTNDSRMYVLNSNIF